VADLVRTKIRKAIAYQLHTITTGADNGYRYLYRNTIAAVYDPPASMEKITMAQMPCVNLYWGRETDNGDRIAGNNPLLDMVLNCEMHCFTMNSEDVSLGADELISDIQALFGKQFVIPDSSGNATAFVCWFKGAESFATDVVKPNIAVVVDLEVRYRIRINQPEIAN
jgi:hypothetical protein